MSFKSEILKSITATPWVQTNCPSVQNSYGTAVTAELAYRETSGSPLKNFWKRKAQGELLPFTHFEQYACSVYSPGSFNEYKLYNGPTCYEWFRNWQPSTASLGLLSVASMRLIADDYVSAAQTELQRAAADLYSDGWDALTFFAEFRKTKKMVEDFGYKLQSYISRFGRKFPYGVSRKEKFSGISKSLSNEYLEARYGWRTLQYDAEDIAKAIARLGKTRGLRRRKSKLHVYTDEKVTTSTLASTGRWSGTWEVIQTTEISVKGSLIADISPPRFAFNPATTAWELVPYSFVVDWFVTVGQTLEAISFVLLSQKYEAAYGLHIKVNTSAMLKNLTYTSPWYATVHIRSGTTEAEYTRRVPSQIPLLPTVHVDLDLWKLLDVVSLVRQALRRM